MKRFFLLFLSIVWLNSNMHAMVRQQTFKRKSSPQKMQPSDLKTPAPTETKVHTTGEQKRLELIETHKESPATLIFLLKLCAIDGYLEAFQKITQYGIYVNAVFDDVTPVPCRSPLHLATRRCHTELCWLIITDPYFNPEELVTHNIFWAACYGGNEEIAQHCLNTIPGLRQENLKPYYKLADACNRKNILRLLEAVQPGLKPKS